MTEKITYDSLLRDDQFLNDSYHALRAQGINVSKKRKDILDRMLTNKRYFDTNVASTFVIGDNVKDMSNENKQSFGRAIDKIEQLPSIGKEGAAPTSDLLKDYLVAGVTDPTNLLSIIAGAFTFGAGGAAVQATKETAKAGIKNLLKAKVKNTLGRKKLAATGKTLLAEGAIAGAGGITQNLKAQDVDMALGRREQGKFDVGSALAQGALEGVASPVAGFALAGIGKAGLEGVKGVGRITGKGLEKTKVGKNILKNAEQAAMYTNRIKNYILPFGGVDDVTQRNFESGRAIFKQVKADTERLVDDIKIAEQRFVKDDKLNVPDEIRLTAEQKRNKINAAMEGDAVALQDLKERAERIPGDAGIYKALTDFVELRKKTYQKVFEYTDPASEKVEAIYKIKPDEYAKTVYDRTARGQRIPFKLWRKYEANDSDIKKYQNVARTDAEEQVRLGIRKGKVDKKTGAVEEVGEINKLFLPQTEGKLDVTKQTKLIDDFAERQVYEGFYPKGKPTKFGGLKTKKEINPILKKIWGVNNSAAVRAAETIGAITEPVSEVLVADQIGRSLVGRGIGVRVGGKDGEVLTEKTARAAALEARPGEDMVPLVGGKEAEDVGIRLPRTDIFNPELGQIFVPRDVAEKIRVLTDTKPVFGNAFLGSLFSGANGYLKKGVTVYNPYGHIRNALGVPQYVAASGNARGIGKYAYKYVTGDKQTKDKFKQIADRLGVTATNVEIGQILGRLSDARKIESEEGVKGFLGRRFLDFASGGVSAVERTKLGTKVSRKAERTYTGTDDVGKLMTLLGERDRAESIFKNLTPEQKQLKREQFARDYGRIDADGNPIIPTKNFKAFDDDMLFEEAATKTLNIVPVYDRVPKILEKMRDIPVLGAFTAFPAENLRNKYNILKLGAQELKEGFETGNKALQIAGVERLKSQITMAALPTIAAYTYNQVVGTDKVEPGVRKSQAEWAQYHALQIRPKGKDEEGNETYGVTDLSYNNPDQYVLDIITPLMMAAASGEDVVEKLDELLPYAIKKTYEPFLSPSMATELGLSFLNYAKSNTDEGRIRHLTNSYKLIEPGFVKLLRDVGGDAAVEDAFNVLSIPLGRGELGTKVRNALNPSYFGDTAKLSKSFTELGFQPTGAASPFALALYPFRLGLKEQDYKPKKQIGFAVSNLMRNANGTLKSTVREIKNNLSNPNRSKNLSLRGILEDYQEAIEEQFAAQQGVFELVNDLKSFMSEDQIKKILQDKKIKTAGGFSNTEITNIIKGRFTVPTLEKTFYRDIIKSNPEILPYYRNISNSLANLQSAYKDVTLQTESLPEVNIGGK